MLRGDEERLTTPAENSGHQCGKAKNNYRNAPKARFSHCF